MDSLDCPAGACSRERAVQAEGVGVSPHCSVASPSLFFSGEEALHVHHLANHSNTSRQIQETSRNVGYTARPTPGEAASPWQATCTVQHDNVEFSAVKAVELLFKKAVAFQDFMCLHVISRAGTC